MFKILLKWLLTLVDFQLTIGIKEDDIHTVLMYKNDIVFEKTLDLMHNGVVKSAVLLQNKSQ